MNFAGATNSSWANYGYLVATHFGGEALQELRILSAVHGIGIIELNKEDISESYIRIPARERIEIDWDMADRLTKENKDFLEYMELISLFSQSGKIRPSDWKLPNDDN